MNPIKLKKFQEIGYYFVSRSNNLKKDGYFTMSEIYDNIYAGIKKAVKDKEIIPDEFTNGTFLFKKETVDKFINNKFGPNFKNRHEIKELGLVTENIAGKMLGFTNLSRWRKWGKITPHFTGPCKSDKPGSYYDITRLKKELESMSSMGVEKGNNKSRADITNEYGIQSTWIKKQNIKPIKTVLGSGGESEVYSPKQVKEMVDLYRKEHGVVFTKNDDKKYITESEAIKNLSSISKWRKDGLVKPLGLCDMGNNSSYYYDRKSIENLIKIKNKLGPKDLPKYLRGEIE